MASEGSSRMVLVAGLVSTGIGVGLFSQMDRIAGASPGIGLMNLASVVSLVLTLLGLLVALAASVLWARRAPLGRVAVYGAIAGCLALAIYGFGNVNVHGATAILGPVAVVSATNSLLVLLIAAMRAMETNRQSQ